MVGSALGCGDGSAPALGSSGDAESTGGEATGWESSSSDGSDSGDEDPPGVAPQCSASLIDSGDARVVVAAEVECSHPQLANHGISVATAGDEVFVGATDYQRAWVFRAAPSEVVTLPEIGAPVFAQRPLLVTDAAGRLYFAGIADIETDDARLEVFRLGASWRREEHGAEGVAQRLLGADATADESLAVWMQTEDRGIASAYKLGPQWRNYTDSLPVEARDPFFAFDRDGHEVCGFVEYVDPETWQLWVQGAGADHPLASDVGAAPHVLVPSRAATNVLDPSLPGYAVLAGDAGDLSVLWPSGGTVLPDTAELVPECETDVEWECPGSRCHDNATGRLGHAMSLARTEDGTLWIAYFHVASDRTFYYDLLCDDIKGSCNCQADIEDNGSTTELRLIAIGRDGVAHAAAPIPLWTSEFPNVLEASARGSRLAIAARVGGTIRMFLLETDPHATLGVGG